MQMRKFPVTALSGRTYEVTIDHERIFGNSYALSFKVIERQQRRNWRGKLREVSVVVESDSYWETPITNVVDIACKLVTRVEDRIEAEAERVASFADFERWDGRIAPEEVDSV